MYNKLLLGLVLVFVYNTVYSNEWIKIPSDPNSKYEVLSKGKLPLPDTNIWILTTIRHGKSGKSGVTAVFDCIGKEYFNIIDKNTNTDTEMKNFVSLSNNSEYKADMFMKKINSLSPVCCNSISQYKLKYVCK